VKVEVGEIESAVSNQTVGAAAIREIEKERCIVLERGNWI